MNGTDGPVAGWYPDPEVPGVERYWDGSRWTEQRRAPEVPAGSPWGTPAAPVGPPAIDTWLWQSIVATVLCCQPLGIVGIVMSAQAGAARDAGNLPLARRRADQARTWTLASVGVGVVLVGGFLLLGLLGTLAGNTGY